jgi:hypothetical protein
LRAQHFVHATATMTMQQGDKRGKKKSNHDKESKPIDSGDPVLRRYQSNEVAASFAVRMQQEEEYAKQVMSMQLQHQPLMVHHQMDAWHYQQQAFVNANFHYEYVYWYVTRVTPSYVMLHPFFVLRDRCLAALVLVFVLVYHGVSCCVVILQFDVLYRTVLVVLFIF